MIAKTMNEQNLIDWLTESTPGNNSGAMQDRNAGVILPGAQLIPGAYRASSWKNWNYKK